MIIRKDLIAEGAALPFTPSILDYHVVSSSLPIPSLYNTPPVFAIYLHGLVLKELDASGGLSIMEARAMRRAALIYGVVDESNGFYVNTVHKSHRSRMSVPITIGGTTAPRSAELEVTTASLLEYSRGVGRE